MTAVQAAQKLNEPPPRVHNQLTAVQAAQKV